MMKLLVIILTIKCIMVSANIPSNDPTTINTSPYDTSSHSSTTRDIRGTKRRPQTEYSEELSDDQFKKIVLETLNKITEGLERNTNILQVHKNVLEVLQENRETQNQRQETIRKLQVDYHLREEATAAQLREAEERRARCELHHNNTQHHLQECQLNMKVITITNPPARDCSDIQHEGVTDRGIYEISPQSSAGVSVLCIKDEEHMWTVFLARQRQTPQEIFNRPWQD
ncbi:hypothetical protein OTU49_013409, partial [Cherax quadricarinatus]